MKTETIRSGDVVKIKPEWQDQGDSRFVWIAVTDASEEREWMPGKLLPARVDIQPQIPGMTFKPIHTVDVSMLVGH